MFFKKIIFFCGLISCLLYQNALAKTDYCKYSTNSFDIHVFQNSYFIESEKGKLKEGFNKLYERLSIGDKLNLIVHEGNEQKKWSQCVPGCPKTTFIKGLTSKCSVEVAKKQKRKFAKVLSGFVTASISAIPSKFDVIDDLKTLEEFYQGKEVIKDTVFVFHTTIPHNVDLNKRETFDTVFANTIQKHDLSRISVSDISFVNSNKSTNVLDFWSDLKLKGHKDGLNVEFKHVNLN